MVGGYSAIDRGFGKARAPEMPLYTEENFLREAPRCGFAPVAGYLQVDQRVIGGVVRY